MFARVPRWIQVGLFGWLLACLLALSPPGQRLETYLLDFALCLRALAYPQRVPVSPDIAIVSVQDSTYSVLTEHPVFWAPLYGRACASLLQGGARMVGLTILPTYAERAKLSPWLALTERRGRVLLPGFLNTDGPPRLQLPASPLLALNGLENVALANLSRDLDGILRRQMLVPASVLQLDHQEWPFMAPELARRSGATVTGSVVQINWAGDGRHCPFPTTRFEELLQHGDDAAFLARFRDKVVLIGSVARLDQDFVDTPFSLLRGEHGEGRSMPGVETQAHILNSLLTRPLLVMGSWPIYAFSAGVCLLVAALALRLPPWRALACTGFLQAVLGVLACKLLLDSSAWPTVLPWLLGSTQTIALAYFVRTREEERAKLLIRGTFDRYVSPEVVQELLRESSGPHRWGVAERRDITVLFSDINGFSARCETTSPEIIATMLQEHYVEMSAVIFAHGGTLIRFVGDQFMVLYGAPVGRPHPERDAIATGLAMLARLEALAREGRDGFYDVKIGIHAGPMLLVSLGSERKSEYTAVGDSANLAARIQDLTKRVGVPMLVSDVVRERAGGMPGVEFVDQGEWEVKGRHGKARVFSVGGGAA